MKKSELLARIEALEARIATLEARPLVQQWWPLPGVVSPTIVPYWPTYTSDRLVVTCNDLLPGQCLS